MTRVAMTPERWRLVKSVVHEALARPDAARLAFVVEACGDDAALRAEVDSLLDVPDTGEGPDDFLASPAGGGIAAAARDFVTGALADDRAASEGAADSAHDAEVSAARAAELFATLATALAGRYELERTVGRGGMATVFLARDLRHRRRVAIKVLHQELGALLGPRRFLREIETVANLSHPHILPLHDSGSVAAGQSPEGDGGDDELLYYVMPYVAGESLRGRLRREGQLHVTDALRVVRQVAAALDYAHRHGVVHRDIKPENILLDEDGHALVADFGIARADQHDAANPDDSVPAVGPDGITERGRVIGTPAYMSPEQARGRRDLDGRSDEYSLACVAFELLAGAAPFEGTSAEQLAARPTQDPVSLVERRPELPPATDAVLARALSLDPEARFDTPSAFAEALAASLFDVASETVSSHRGTPAAALVSAETNAQRPSTWREQSSCPRSISPRSARCPATSQARATSRLRRASFRCCGSPPGGPTGRTPLSAASRATSAPRTWPPVPASHCSQLDEQGSPTLS